MCMVFQGPVLEFYVDALLQFPILYNSPGVAVRWCYGGLHRLNNGDSDSLTGQTTPPLPPMTVVHSQSKQYPFPKCALKRTFSHAHLSLCSDSLYNYLLTFLNLAVAFTMPGVYRQHQVEKWFVKFISSYKLLLFDTLTYIIHAKNYINIMKSIQQWLVLLGDIYMQVFQNISICFICYILCYFLSCIIFKMPLWLFLVVNLTTQGINSVTGYTCEGF